MCSYSDPELGTYYVAVGMDVDHDGGIGDGESGGMGGLWENVEVAFSRDAQRVVLEVLVGL